MPRERIAMHHIEEILRLRHEAGRTQREIASGCGMSQSRVQKVLARARAAGVGWPLPAELDEGALQELIYGRPMPSPAGLRYRTEPDFEYLQRDSQHGNADRRGGTGPSRTSSTCSGS